MSLVRTTGIPAAPAAISLSRTEMRRRPMPRSRHSRTMRMETISTARENHAKARSEVSPSPNSDGREINVDSGSGSPEQIFLCRIGMVQHDVASTDVCMKSANPSVLTARYRPRMRRAVSPTSTDTTAVAAPARSRSGISGTLAPRCAVMSAPTATNPNWPSDTWPAQPVRTVSDKAMTP